MRNWIGILPVLLMAALAFGTTISCSCGVTGDDDSGGDDTGNNTDDDTAVDDDTVPTIEAPCPGQDAPGEYNCDGCPDIELPDGYEFSIELSAVTTYQFTSANTGPVTGNDGDGSWYLLSSVGTGMNGGELGTDTSGNFDITIPLFCKQQVFKTAWSNASGTYCLVHSINNTDCIEGDIRVTLTWGAGSNDLELHLIRDGGKLNNTDGGTDDCTWTNMNPDWGVEGDTSDNPQKDVDWTGDNGVENIYLPNPENVVYHVFVEYWADGVPASPQIVFNVDGETTVDDITGFNPKEVWYVGTIDWPTRTVTRIDNVFDCSGDWSSGCVMDLP